MSMQIRNVQVKNQFLLWLGLLSLIIALMIMLLPEAILQQIRNIGQSLGVWWLYLIDFSNLIFLALGFFLLDKATDGTWWTKRVGD